MCRVGCWTLPHTHTHTHAAVCFFHIRWLCQIRCRVVKNVTICLVLTLITPQLDYCNSVLTCLPQSTRAITEGAERHWTPWLVFDLRHRDHVAIFDATIYTCCLSGHECSLNFAHWCTPFTTKDPHCLSLRRCTDSDCGDSNYSLWSSIIRHYRLCRTADTFQVRRAGLRVCRSRCLNRLPEHSRRQSTPATFRRHLKTFLFAEVFNTTSNFEQL